MLDDLPITTEKETTLPYIEKEKAEVQAAIISAKKFPRDENAAYAKIMKSMGRLTIAEKSIYSYPRGGANIVGPSIGMAREMSRCWGNMKSGIKIMDVDSSDVHIKGFAIDLETNSSVEAEDKFKKLVQRKRNGATQWVAPDERDLRELINKRGAILVRNCILQLLPSDFIEDAKNAALHTLKKASEGELETNKDDSLKKLAATFLQIGVTTDMLEKYLACKLSLISPAQLAELRTIYRSIVDGNSTAKEFFALEESAAEELTKKLKK